MITVITELLQRNISFLDIVILFCHIFASLVCARFWPIQSIMNTGTRTNLTFSFAIACQHIKNLKLLLLFLLLLLLLLLLSLFLLSLLLSLLLSNFLKQVFFLYIIEITSKPKSIKQIIEISKTISFLNISSRLTNVSFDLVIFLWAFTPLCFIFLFFSIKRVKSVYQKSNL